MLMNNGPSLWDSTLTSLTYVTLSEAQGVIVGGKKTTNSSVLLRLFKYTLVRLLTISIQKPFALVTLVRIILKPGYTDLLTFSHNSKS